MRRIIFFLMLALLLCSLSAYAQLPPLPPSSAGGGGAAYDSAGVAYHADVADAMDYSTLEFFPWLWNKLYDLKLERDTVRMDSTVHTHTQIRVAKFGDSIGGRKGMYIIPLLQAAYGVGGTNAAGGCSGGAAHKGDVIGERIYGIAPGGYYYILPSGGSIYWGVANGNVLHVMYLAEPGAGSFKIQTSFRGNPYVDEVGYTNISADSTTRSLQVITITKDTADIWYVKLVGLSDTVRTLDAYCTTDLVSGVEDITWAGSGMALTDWMECDTSILRVYLQTIKPDLIFMEWKDPLTGWKAALDSCFSRFLRARPSIEFVCLGTTPISGDNTETIATNRVLRTESKVYNQFYWDSYLKAGVYSKLVSLGWNGDGTHLDPRADTYYASLLMHDMKIFDNIYQVSPYELKVDYVTALKGIDIGSTTTTNLSQIRPNGLSLDFITGRDFSFETLTGDHTLGRDAYGPYIKDFRIGYDTHDTYLLRSGGKQVSIAGDINGNTMGYLAAERYYLFPTGDGMWGGGFYDIRSYAKLLVQGANNIGKDTLEAGDSLQVTVAGMTVDGVVLATYGQATTTSDVPLWTRCFTGGFTVYGTNGKQFSYQVVKKD